MSKNEQNNSESRREDWQTPIDLFQFLDVDCGFNFIYDCAANAENSICDFYIDEKTNFLKTESFDPFVWHWINPPYLTGQRAKEKILWMEKIMSVPNIVALIPASTGARWFQPIWDHANAICFLRHRLKFVHPERGELAAAQFDCCLAIHGTNGGYIHRLNEIGNTVLLRDPTGRGMFGQYCGPELAKKDRI